MIPTRPLRTLHLEHIHLPKLTPYLRAASIQERYVRKHLDHKARPSTITVPNPTLLSFQTPPTYTCGRREVGSLSAGQIDHLRDGGRAEFHEALRGGQTTFHGPGQLTAYLICSLQSHDLTARRYVRFLEESVVETSRQLFGLKCHTSEAYPGVWVTEKALIVDETEKKIASVGVHLRRNVTSHGIGLNLTTDLGWFERITACGLPGNVITKVQEQLEIGGKHGSHTAGDPSNLDIVANRLADIMVSRLRGVVGKSIFSSLSDIP